MAEKSYYDSYQAALYAAATSATTSQSEEPALEDEEWEEEDSGGGRRGNVLPFWGNQQTMNLNPLILTNIQNSPYYKSNLFDLKTYHEVVDEIYYKVAHLEPWEKGSRKTSGQTGMCGGVRGVGAGGIVSSAFCLLYKLSTLKLTRKQINGLLIHADSPYIRGLGFMYLRFTQPPGNLLEWFEDYLDDEEVIDVKAGGGKEITIGEMLKQFLTKPEWFDTRFPRIPVNVQKEITDYFEQLKKYSLAYDDQEERKESDRNHDRSSRGQSRERRDHRDHRDENSRNRSRDRRRSRSRDRDRRRSRERSDKSKDHRSSGNKERRRSRSRDHHDKRQRYEDDYQKELRHYSHHRKKENKHKRKSRSRSRERRY